jgi:hypothetical protein
MKNTLNNSMVVVGLCTLLSAAGLNANYGSAGYGNQLGGQYNKPAMSSMQKSYSQQSLSPYQQSDSRMQGMKTGSYESRRQQQYNRPEAGSMMRRDSYGSSASGYGLRQ